MNKININKNKLNNTLYGDFENKSVIDNIFKGGNILPKPVTYNEIHDEFVTFVNLKLETKHEGEIIPTFYYSQQRFSEFSKTWEHVDENKNIQANFKIITRENNPKKGSALGEYYNIPGDDFYTLGTAEKWDNGKNITISYKAKQPYCVDFIYEIKIIANKMDLLNDFNNKVQDVFKSKQAYIRPNGHFMTVNLEDF